MKMTAEESLLEIDRVSEGVYDITLTHLPSSHSVGTRVVIGWSEEQLVMARKKLHKRLQQKIERYLEDVAAQEKLIKLGFNKI